VPETPSDLIEELVLANRILANEGVFDAFGHVSVRHPADPGRYLLSRARAPLLIEPDDILEYNLESEPLTRSSMRPYSERVIHGCIYQARGDVVAVCHNHAPALMPFCVSGKPVVPISHVGATMGTQAPFWDQADEFGDTNLLVVKPEEGQSLARTLGKHSVVLMRRHGATVVGGSLKELVARSIFLCENARYQMQAYLLGVPTPLRPGEVKPAGDGNVLPAVLERNWEYWVHRLAMAGEWPPAAKAGGAAPGATTEKEKRRRP
jgi:HCOMODA/2-hydroxy-3-carboxy-muconic semialdehyde decarboxylase